MRVHMDCGGCQSKVRSALEKLKGVDTVEIDLSLQKVTITGWADQKKVLKAVRKTGRRAELWQLPYNAECDNYSIYNQHHCNGPTNLHAPQSSSHYNYYKHGYDNSSYGRYYNYHGAHSTTFGHQTSAAFSDENPHACSIM
ncbi:heavy metal-associated isoprenylated plant protein 28-like isoform X2 [Punica granatum]|nr:heavy metal-associated isoprenylated plant protein 28-like isoform X2 [Punica granatum]OWM78708.1 hypothetical protein CDL15_Pgr002879 [Punica granatum]